MKRTILFIVVILIVGTVVSAQAQTILFTYQGKLSDTGTPTTNYDFEFRLYDAPTGGTLLGTRQQQNVPVLNGVFSVKIDFGPNFNTGATRYLEIAVRNAGGASFQTLTPREQITSAPFNIRSLSAANADQLGGIGASGFIQNMITPQSANFNILGSGLLSGTLGIGVDTFVETPIRLDVKGRSRFRQYSDDTGGINSAGIWLYQNGAVADRAFVGMQDDNNVGFYGNNGGGWGISMNTQTGNVGIGTNSPAGKFHINVPGSSNPISALTLDVGTFGTGTNAVNSYYFRARDVGSGGAPAFLIRGDGHVGIGTSTPASALEVNGYTKLGSDAPAIRVKKVTATTAANEGGIATIFHGLDSSKILSVSVMVNYIPNHWLGPDNTSLHGFRFSWVEGGGAVSVTNVFGSSANILSKPIKILITYEQ
ncbi:MAG: hypothetical protein ACT4O9_15740 [Blastocatellia bacterium]